MDEPFTCTCQMKTDLENSADVFSFFKENYPYPVLLIILINFPIKSYAVPVA